jgi:hypothetical protein
MMGGEFPKAAVIAVLQVLPLCLRGDAREWYTHLSDDITLAMQTSVNEWVIIWNFVSRKTL